MSANGVTINKPKPKNPTDQSTRLTETEIRLVFRMRQLFSSGADILLVERKNNRPRVRKVGKAEG